VGPRAHLGTVAKNYNKTCLAEPGKGKVKLSLCLIKHHAMKTCGGIEVPIAPPFLTSALSGVLHASAALSQGKGPRYPLDRSLRASLDAVERNILLLPGIELRPSSLSLYRLSSPGSWIKLKSVLTRICLGSYAYKEKI
jgi:hypothetical protein